MNTRPYLLAAAMATGLMLGGCFGGDDDAAPVPPAAAAEEVPASAVANPQALVDWSNAQPTSETQEPLSVLNVTPPLSDSDEPASIR